MHWAPLSSPGIALTAVHDLRRHDTSTREEILPEEWLNGREFSPFTLFAYACMDYHLEAPMRPPHLAAVADAGNPVFLDTVARAGLRVLVRGCFASAVFGGAVLLSQRQSIGVSTPISPVTAWTSRTSRTGGRRADGLAAIHERGTEDVQTPRVSVGFNISHSDATTAHTQTKS